MALLEVKDLKTSFRTDDGVVGAVDGVSFTVEKGQTLGIVGESGSGKSVTCLTIMGLNAKRNTITTGEALWKGDDLLTMSSRQLRQLRGNDIAMIFQDCDELATRPSDSHRTKLRNRWMSLNFNQLDLCLRETTANLLSRLGIAAIHDERFITDIALLPGKAIETFDN